MNDRKLKSRRIPPFGGRAVSWNVIAGVGAGQPGEAQLALAGSAWSGGSGASMRSRMSAQEEGSGRALPRARRFASNGGRCFSSEQGAGIDARRGPTGLDEVVQDLADFSRIRDDRN